MSTMGSSSTTPLRAHHPICVGGHFSSPCYYATHLHAIGKSSTSPHDHSLSACHWLTRGRIHGEFQYWSMHGLPRAGSAAGAAAGRTWGVTRRNCAAPRGRSGQGCAPRRATEASGGSLRRCREGARGAQARGDDRPVARATILLACLCAALRCGPTPAFGGAAKFPVCSKLKATTRNTSAMLLQRCFVWSPGALPA